MLARAMFLALFQSHVSGRIELSLLVLNERGPESTDPLFGKLSKVRTRWCARRRWRFILSALKNSPGFLIFDHAGPARSLSLIPRLFRPEYAMCVHGVEVWENARADHLKAVRAAKLLIANSNYTASRIKQTHDDLPRMEVCWPGVSTSDLPVYTDESPRLSGSRDILIVGRLSSVQRHKGHDLLLEAMPHILAPVPNARLIIVGEGDDRQRLEDKSASLGIEARVRFTGWVGKRQLNDLYRDCAVFAMPSKGDGFGFVYLEAMAHAKPCVGLRDGSAAEIVLDGLTGILVDRDKPAETASSIGNLLEDGAKRDEMGKRGLERLQSHFLQSHYEKRFMDILNRLMLRNS